jgi:hypothetical protein
LGGGKGRFKVEVGKVDRPKEGIGRDNRVEEDVYTGEGSDKGRGRDGRFETVASGGATHPPVDVRVVGAIRAG